MTTRFPDSSEEPPTHPLRRRSSTSPSRRRPGATASALPTWEPRDASVHASRTAEPNGHAAARLRTYSSNRHSTTQQERRGQYPVQQQHHQDVAEGSSKYSSHEAAFDPNSTLVASPLPPHHSDRHDVPFGMHPLTIEHQATSYDDDRLSPLLARPTRRRFDSLSSVGSSVAPGALPALPGTGGGPASGNRRSRGNSSKRESSIGAGTAAGATGGLETWLRSQAVPPAPPTTSSSASHGAQPVSGAPPGRVRRHNAGSDAGSEAGRSATGWSTGPRHGSGALRQRETTASRRLPDWEASGLLTAQEEEQRASRRGASLSAGTGVPRREKDVSTAGGITPSGSGLLSSSGRNAQGSEAQLTPAKSVASSRTTFAPLPSASLGLRSGRTTLGSAATSGVAKVRATASPLRRWVRWMAREGTGVGGGAGEGATWIVGLLLVLVLKWSVSLGGWSGREKPPMWGDFEAQRHWMELTLHLPSRQWYEYDTAYWGLDYPPLTAYVSWLCGYVGTLIPGLAASFDLFTSRGSESANLVVYLRATVLFFDQFVYTPAVLFFLSRRLHGRGRRTRSMAAVTILAQPALILIDHGHFQYNSFMLGFAAASFALLYTSLPNPDLSEEGPFSPLSVRSGRSGAGAAADTPEAKEETEQRKTKTTHLSRRVSYDYVAAAFFFSLSLCFKQMALFYAPAVFAIMLGRCWGLASVGFERGLICFTGIGAVTLLTFLAMFLPWLGELSALLQVIHRIFPLARGIFEDKVANVWCFLSVLPLPAAYKLKNVMSPAALARLSMGTTLAAVFVPCAHLCLAAKETVKLEMFLDEGVVEEKSRKRKEATPSVAASVRSGRSGRKLRQQTSDGSVVGRGANAGAQPQQLKGSSRLRTRSTAGSDAGSEMLSLVNARAALSLSGGVPGSNASVLGGLSESLYAGSISGVSMHSTRQVASHTPSPAASVLPYALLSCSLAFFLFGFQTHEKSVLIPLLPLCLLMTVKGDEWGGGAGKTDWEWAVLGNNVAVFSMWPLLKRDELGLQYLVLTLLWNWVIGFQPFAQLRSDRKSFIGWTSATVHLAILVLHFFELSLPTLLPTFTQGILTRYPDIWAVLNVLLCAPVLGLIWVWSLKRQLLEVGVACGIEPLGFLSLGGAAKEKRKESKGRIEEKEK